MGKHHLTEDEVEDQDEGVQDEEGGHAEDAQEGASDGEGGVESEDNTPADTHTNTAGTSQESLRSPSPLEEGEAGRVRRFGRTKYCGVVSRRMKEPQEIPRNKGEFRCIICNSRFTRREGVNYHFSGCVREHGNPNGNRWFDHESCMPERPSDTQWPTDPTDRSKPAAKKPRMALLPTSGGRVTRSMAAQSASTSQPSSGTVSTEGSSVPKQKAPETFAARPRPTRPEPEKHKQKPAPKPTQSEPEKKQPKPNAREIPNRKSQSKQASGAGKSGKFHLAEDLSPLSDIGLIFRDMVSNASDNIGLKEKLKPLSQKKIYVATMCSGTESPLLALGQILKGLKDLELPGLDIEHRFSAEIVVWKQSFIENNFHPQIIFRDIREMAAGKQATTAYGALVDVPIQIHILIVGPSCVDFSTMNKNQKKLEDNGESAETFIAVLIYAKKARPSIIIIENVDGAPWEFFRAIWENDREGMMKYGKDNREFDNFWDADDPAYSAMWVKVDAKNYYIPQTRMRRYMVCINRRLYPSRQLADQAAEDWKRNMVSLQRKASATVEAFLLAEDEPRLQYAKDEMSKTGKVKRETDWELCLARHEDYRTKEKLGVLRPITGWTNNGFAKITSYIWPEWYENQVERVWDTIDISYNRNAAKGIDSFFKSRFWELSQNVDRFLDGTPEGVIGCLTPRGQQFSTIRGRPVIGLEALALQGLPIDSLILTRESQRELADLAGNAMTSTVVGAAILSALAVGHDILGRKTKSTLQPLLKSSPALEKMRFSELQQKQTLNFDGSGTSSIEELRQMAMASVRLCYCEGQSLTALALIRKCRRCHHHCCETCGNTPKHDYERLGGDGSPLRVKPQDFRKEVELALPTRLEMDGFPYETLESFAQNLPNYSLQDWTIFSEAILLAFNEGYRYQSTKRSHCWTIVYHAAHSRLELCFHEKGVYWLLYGKVNESEAVNSRARELLNQPLARLTVRGRNMRGKDINVKNVLSGSWEIRLPIVQTFSILVTPQGELTDSWEKKLGLQGENFVDKQVSTSLKVSRVSETAAGLILDHDIYGDYDLLDNCGTSCCSLHKKRSTNDISDAPPLFLYLNVDRNGPPERDSFVFSTDIQRLEYGETRYVSIKVDSNWRPPYTHPDPLADFMIPHEVECAIFSRWESCSIVLRPYRGSEEASVRFPKDDISIPVFTINQYPSIFSSDDVYGCLLEASTTVLLSCEIPGQLADSIGWQVGHWTVIDQKSERHIAAMFQWLFARVKDLGGFGSGWRSLGSHPSGYQNCSSCAPKPPKIRWTCSRGGKQNKIIPYEDGREAGNFERKIKARPAPFLVQTLINDDEKHTGRLLVGLNLQTLVHRALAELGNIADGDEIATKWRLDTRWEAPVRYKLKEFSLTNNKLFGEVEYVFPTGEELRPEQKRSVKWMIGQEGHRIFIELVIDERVLSQLGWRGVVRVERKRLVRGGILADEVGYGKTATTLALIDMQKKSAEDHERREISGRLSVKATLILVPPHLVHQWKGQIKKFLGWPLDDEKIVIIEDLPQLLRTSIEQIQKALIVLVSWSIFSTPSYMARMSHFAALPMGPSSGGREIEAWLTRACDNIEKHMGELVSGDINFKEFAKVLQQRLKGAYNDETILRDVPTSRLKGAKYKTWDPAERVTPVDPTPNDEDLTKLFKHIADVQNLKSIKGILLHMFHFHRIVVDEYTYVDHNLAIFITMTKASSRWVLSGTPNIQDFGEVKHLASFIGCNLGVVDDAAGVLKGATIRHIRDHRTAAEQFRAFGFIHTPMWHIEKQAHGQWFLDNFASKNIPEIGLIKSVLHIHPHFLGAAETIPNAELQQRLQASDMKIVLQGKTKQENAQFRRYQELLKGCKTASECLIKSCAYFEIDDMQSHHDELLDGATKSHESPEDPMDIDEAPEDAMDTDASPEDAMEIDDDNAPQSHDDEKIRIPSESAKITCQSLISVREKEMEALRRDLEDDLLHAEWLEQQYSRGTKGERQESHYFRWKKEIEESGIKDPAATAKLRRWLIRASNKVDDNTENLFYRNKRTAEEITKEKDAADKRKKREKAKRREAKKSKDVKEGNVKRKTPSKAAGNKDVVDSDDGEDPKDDRIPRENIAEFATKLRGITNHLRSLVAEFTSRSRSLRFARGAHSLQRWHADKREPSPTCRSCGKLASHQDDISINIRCGHITCQECIQEFTVVCAVEGCNEGSESYRLRKAGDLVGDGKDWEHGSRLGNIIELISSLPEDEQVLLFVQFEDVMLNMAQGLEKANISNYALYKSAGNREMVRMMNDFQENHGKDKKKVLLLNPSSETASGVNLTNVNHVIFASPLLTNTKQSYDALTTQCIGRAKRYGQQKTVHIYRFVALRTVDVDILEEREQMTLVKKEEYSKGRDPIVEWALVKEDMIDDLYEDMEAGWGSGYNFKSNPAEDDD